jgi:hypothetical protein
MRSANAHALELTIFCAFSSQHQQQQGSATSRPASMKTTWILAALASPAFGAPAVKPNILCTRATRPRVAPPPATAWAAL